MSELFSMMLRSFILAFFFGISLIQVKCHTCDDMHPYESCARYFGCQCFYSVGPPNTTICIQGYLKSCSELVRCGISNYECHQRDHQCIYHPRCFDYPVCYPVPSFNTRYCLPLSKKIKRDLLIQMLYYSKNILSKKKISFVFRFLLLLVIPSIPKNATWAQNGITVAGGKGQGSATHQLYGPWGLFVDSDQTVIIADQGNQRIIQVKKGDTKGQIVAGGNDKGSLLNQLAQPTDVLIDKETDTLIICDWGNRRVVQWSRHNDTEEGEVMIDNIDCWGLAMDDRRHFYVSDTKNHEVRRYRLGHKNGSIVAGGHGQGMDTNQLNQPRYLFIDGQRNIYVSDYLNHRVMKWNVGAEKGIVAAGNQGQGNNLTQLSNPNGIFVDKLGTVYVADSSNNRVMRWPEGATEGTIALGRNGPGVGADQFHDPVDLACDRQGNIYIVDDQNHRVQKFSVE